MEFSWVERLAQTEILNQSNAIEFDWDDPDIEKIMQRETRVTMNWLYEQFLSVANIFNSKLPSALIKVYRINQNSADFVVFRKSLKLVFQSNEFGRIDIFFSNYLDQYIVKHHPEYKIQLKAELAPFDELKWHYDQELVNLEAMVKHFSTAFIKQSFHSS